MIPILDIVSSFNISFDLFRKIAGRFFDNKFRIVPMLRCLICVPLLKSSERGIAKILVLDKRLARICGFKGKIPHRSWISRFRNIVGDLWEDIFYELVRKLKQMKIVSGKDWSLDSTHFKAYSNKWKKVKSDKDASWGYKNQRQKYFFGYKEHCICDSKTELPISFIVTTGKVHDSKPAISLIRKTHQKTNLLAEIIRADAAYNSTDIRQEINRYQAKAVIPHKGEARKKKKENKRVSIEHVFSRQKESFNLDNLKLRGLKKAIQHVALTLIAQLQTALTAVIKGQPEKIREAGIR